MTIEAGQQVRLVSTAEIEVQAKRMRQLVLKYADGTEMVSIPRVAVGEVGTVRRAPPWPDGLFEVDFEHCTVTCSQVMVEAVYQPGRCIP